jgi:hypothetical protein
VRALAMLELQRRRFVRDRTQAIQRLRADWTQHDPVGEAAALRCDRQRELRKLKPSTSATASPDGSQHAASENSHARSKTSTSGSLLWTARSPSSSPPTATPWKTSRAPAAISLRRSSPKPVMFAASATPAPSPATAAPPLSRADPDRPADVTDYTEEATANSTPPSTASRSSNNATTPRQAIPRPQIAQGKTPREARRALKRHLANTLYRHLYQWAENTLPANITYENRAVHPHPARRLG